MDKLKSILSTLGLECTLSVWAVSQLPSSGFPLHCCLRTWKWSFRWSWAPRCGTGGWTEGQALLLSDLLGGGCSWVPVDIGTSDPNLDRCEGSTQRQCLVVVGRAPCPWAVLPCRIQQGSVRGQVSLLMGRHQSLGAGEVQVKLYSGGALVAGPRQSVIAYLPNNLVMGRLALWLTIVWGCEKIPLIS